MNGAGSVVKQPLDDLDRRIVALLQQDGRRSYTDLAAHLGVSEGTARQRTLRLLGSGALQVVGVANPFRLGFDTMALIGVVARLADCAIDALAGRIAALPEVSYVVMCTGSFDLMIEVICASNEELKLFLTEKLHPLAGVARTETFMILEVYKMALGGWRLAADLLAALPTAPLREE
jgi:Lrp/AsnC family transcriptional regulator for asnA, asnC and gidA